MKKNQTGLLIFIALAGLFLTGCKKEYYDLERISNEMEWTPQLVAPLVYGSVSMTDITELFDSIDYVGEFDDGLIYFAYNDTVASFEADTSVTLPVLTTHIVYDGGDPGFESPLPVPVGDTFDVPRRTESLDFALEGDNRIDRVLVKGGTIRIDMTSSFRHTGVLTISSEEILDAEGDPFSTSIDIDNDMGNFVGMQEVPSDGFTILPRQRNDSNIFTLNFDLSLINSGNPVTPGESAQILTELIDIGFYEIEGFLDPGDLLKHSGSIEIPLWEDNPDLTAVTFADPRIGIIMSSSFGIPFSIDLDSVVAIGPDGDELFLDLVGGNTLEFAAPGLDQKGETVVTEHLFNRNTSNIDQILALTPSEIAYSVKGETSTTGDDTVHYILDESKVDLALEFLLPLDFKSSGFALTDTLEFSLGEDGVDTATVRNVELTFTTTNELPVELRLQAVFLDENYMVLDSVFDDNAPLLAASVVDEATGRLVEASTETNTIEFPASKLGALEQVAYLQLSARILTSAGGGPFVKIYSDYSLDYKVSMFANLRINTSE